MIELDPGSLWLILILEYSAQLSSKTTALFPVWGANPYSKRGKRLVGVRATMLERLRGKVPNWRLDKLK